MSEAATASSPPSLSRASRWVAELAPWRPAWSRPAALRAARAMVVVPGVFAFADEVLGNLQVATFAAFGGFATLVLVSFDGTRRDKLVSHVGFALACSALLSIGTAVTSSTVLAVGVTVLVAFVVFFCGVAGPHAAAAVNGALLAYVLPAASPGTVSMIPDRLAGWWLASVAGTASVLLVSPPSGSDRLRTAASRSSGAVAAAVESMLRGETSEPELGSALDAKHALRAAFTATPYRPTGLAPPDEALASAIELLEWSTSLVMDMVSERPDVSGADSSSRALLEAAAATLRDVESLFAGARVHLDLDALAQARERGITRLEALPARDAGFPEDARLAFHADMIAVATFSLAANALVAERLADPVWLEQERERVLSGPVAGSAPRRRLAALAGLVRRHASVRSVWVVNSVRGAIALGAAVAVADLTTVQHGFWVVLGTLSVLRTNAIATGATALRALVGTAIGFVIGGALLVVIGADSNALWVVLPIAVFVAAYTPGTAPFAIGQAAFTVTVAVLYNLLVPAGWQVGVVRIEDVALGCGVSIIVGTLFWPRGLATVVGDDLADAYRAGADYLRQAVQWVAGAQDEQADGGAAATTAARLDAGLRGFLAEQGSKHLELRELFLLVGGTLRLRLTAYSIARLPRDGSLVGTAQAAMLRRTSTLAGWFERLAELLARRAGGALPATLAAPVFGPGETVPLSSGSHYGVWLCEHLDHLAEHTADMSAPALHLAEVRRRPWWR